MARIAEDAPATVTAALKMSIAGRPIEAHIEVPAGPTKPRQLLPILQWFTGEVVAAASDQVKQKGKSISCRAGCGACCRQLVPISQAEAYQIAELVDELPEPRRGEVRRRFQESGERLAAAGLFDGLMEPGSLPADVARSIRLDYFRLGIACPFLEDESCSIYPDRPLFCREYLVTSPAENCRRATAEPIDQVALPVQASKALLAQERSDGKKSPSWVPLTLALRWGQDHPEPEPARTGPELMGEFLQQLSGREMPAPGELARAPDKAPTAAAQAQSPAEAYDEIPYQSQAHTFTHPSIMAALAMLHGMTPAAVEGCQVLELGCASGGNLIPMAAGLPGSRFVGLDVSPRQVGDGCGHIERLGLKNVELWVMDLMDVDRSFGEFDYIICHGVFSWVPRPVQDKILSICAQNLAPQGLAMVSYNTYPFWRLRGMVREMMLYHLKGIASARERLRQGRQFLEFLATNCAAPKSAYERALQEEVQTWRRHVDDYLRHDQLGEINEPCYFHEFAARLSDHGLQYFGDARAWDREGILSNDARRQLDVYRDDLVRYEQHLDFLCQGGFRRSLLIHNQVPVDRAARPDVLDRLWLSAGAKPVANQPIANQSSTMLFRSQDGDEFSTDVPWMQAALRVLAESWPRQFTFAELCQETRRALGDAPDARLDPMVDPEVLRLPILDCALKQLVELHAHRWPDVAPRSDRPRATPLARLQAEIGSVATGQRLQMVQLRELDRQLLLRLDGRLSRAELIQNISTLIESGEFALTPVKEEKAAADPPDLPTLIDDALVHCANFGWLDG